jgi:hypothetical protein
MKFPTSHGIVYSTCRMRCSQIIAIPIKASSRPPARIYFWVFEACFKVCGPQSCSRINGACHQRALWCNGLHTGYILIKKHILKGRSSNLRRTVLLFCFLHRWIFSAFRTPSSIPDLGMLRICLSGEMVLSGPFAWRVACSPPGSGINPSRNTARKWSLLPTRPAPLQVTTKTKSYRRQKHRYWNRET